MLRPIVVRHGLDKPILIQTVGVGDHLVREPDLVVDIELPGTRGVVRYARLPVRCTGGVLTVAPYP